MYCVYVMFTVLCVLFIFQLSPGKLLHPITQKVDVDLHRAKDHLSSLLHSCLCTGASHIKGDYQGELYTQPLHLL